MDRHPDYQEPLGTCETCRWWECLDGGTGKCRIANPLHVFGEMEAKWLSRDDSCIKKMGYWPETFDDDWCGEYRPRKAEAGE